MNRKQRRAALKQSTPLGTNTPSAGAAAQLFAQAVQFAQHNKLDDAARAYKRVLTLKPDHADTINNLGCVLQTQGKLNEASACFARALLLMPQVFRDYNGIYHTLVSVLPPIGDAVRRTVAAWPKRLAADELLGSAGIATIADDPLLLCMLQSVPAREIALERVLTSLRLSLLNDAVANKPASASIFVFACALAKQCFINEYVFATTPDEDAKVERLKESLASATAAGGAIAPISLAALAMYQPLHALPDAHALLDGTWPRAVDDVLTQQLREPLQEQQLRDSIPRLTTIDDDTSLRVRQQYEENPYPRWVHVVGNATPVSYDQYLRHIFPAVAFTSLGKTEAVDVLVAGCGTGWQTTGIALTYKGAGLLAVDLSLSSLCFAKRNTPPSLSSRIEYAQGDILKLGAIGRSFDVIYANGVLHHMADPMEAWGILLSLLRPGGIMNLGFYSELGRADVVAARAFIAERGYRSTPADIRRCRQDLLATRLQKIARVNDFFSTSECRDMLFHVQEQRMTIPAIKAFIGEHALRFLGFEVDQRTLQKFRSEFAGSSMTDLDRWHALETRSPDIFESMYQFWVQKS
jgi:SAM-dependent methyltransferase